MCHPAPPGRSTTACPKGQGAAVIRRRRSRSAAPCGSSHRWSRRARSSIPVRIPSNSSIQKVAPWGLRPLPPVPRPIQSCPVLPSPGASPIGFWAYDGPKIPSKTAQDGQGDASWSQDGRSWSPMAPDSPPRWPKRPPRWPRRRPRRLKRGPWRPKLLKNLWFSYDFYDSH